MEVIDNYKNFTATKKSVVTIGTFDGVHVGHQKIIEQLVNTAKKTKAKSVLLTFFPHPRMVLQKDNSIKLINTINERIELLKNTGLDYLIIHPFDKEFSRLTAFDFVRTVLVNHINTSELIIGYDHRFGKNREGNFEQLQEFGHMYDFKVNEIPAQDINNISVSSTKIRKALEEANIKQANKYLGQPFSLTGKVVSGKRLGNTIGYPTANIEIKENYKLIPKKGAYLVRTSINNQNLFGMMNIGIRPTVNGEDQTIEVHLFDFNLDIYNQQLKIELLDFIRDEQKFESLEHLKEQLLLDKTKSLSLIGGLN
ncbi:bifunctional riboflavin kinase/FAD synthetase [Bacteroidota bacterium]